MSQFRDNPTVRTVGKLLAEAERQPKNDGYEWTFEELVCKENGAYVFLDRVFDTDNNLHGAVGSSMVPVTQEEYDRRVEEFKDYDYSPVAHIYDEENTPESWDEWIKGWEHDFPEVILDTSYSFKYGPIVKEKFREETGEEPEFVECIGGGRMFRDYGYSEVYREDLLTLIHYAEENGLTEFF